MAYTTAFAAAATDRASWTASALMAILISLPPGFGQLMAPSSLTPAALSSDLSRTSTAQHVAKQHAAGAGRESFIAWLRAFITEPISTVTYSSSQMFTAV